jgi:hypothetical protein
MASIPSVTSVISSLTQSYSPTAIDQLASGSALAEAQATDSPVVIDIYEGNTAANQAGLQSYIQGRFYEPASPEQAAAGLAVTAAPDVTVETITTGSITETAGQYTAPTLHGSESSLWSYTSADTFDPGLGNVTAAYTITLTPDGADAESATITAADGTTSTTVIQTNAPASTPAPAAAASQLTDGNDAIALAVDAQGNFNASFTHVSSSTGESTTLAAAISYGTTLAVDTDSPPAELGAGPQQAALTPVASPATPVQFATKAAPTGADPDDAEELQFSYQHGFGIGTDDGVVTGVSQFTYEDLSLSDLTTGSAQQQSSATAASSSTPAASESPTAATPHSGLYALLSNTAAAPFTVTSAAATQSIDAERVTFLTPYSAPTYSGLKFVDYARATYGNALAVAAGSAINTTG